MYLWWKLWTQRKSFFYWLAVFFFLFFVCLLNLGSGTFVVNRKMPATRQYLGTLTQFCLVWKKLTYNFGYSELFCMCFKTVELYTCIILLKYLDCTMLFKYFICISFTFILIILLFLYWLINCSYFNVQWVVYHLDSRWEQGQQYITIYTDMTEAWDNIDNDFWLPLEQYGELDKDEKLEAMCLLLYKSGF